MKGENNYLQVGLNILNRILKDPEFLNCQVEGRAYEIPKEDIHVLDKAGLFSQYLAIRNYSKELVNTFKQRSISASHKNHHLGKFKRNEADNFANSMGPHLQKAREAFHVTTREIANYLNSKNISSAQGGTWTATSVSAVIRRRQKLGLENQDEIARKYKQKKSLKDEYDIAKSFSRHLEKVRAEGIISTRKIADRFNKLEITTKTGKEWSHVTVHNMIKKIEDLGLE